MKYFTVAIFFILLNLDSLLAQDSTGNFEDQNETQSEDKEYDDTKKWKLEPLLGYTFSNRGGWANITPEIFLGFDTLIYKSSNKKHNFRLRSGPTISSSSNDLDSGSFFRAIMLPGPANLSANAFYTFSIFQDKLQLVNMFGGSLKMMGSNTENKSLTQNNIKFGTGLEILKLLLISAEHTWAWHNITNEAEENFNKTFHTCHTKVRYLTITVEGYSEAMDMYIVFSWRKFLTAYNFSENYTNDQKIVSIGIKKDLDLVTPASNK
ncbi:MAG: hypothetical protein EOP53_08800 [Sphingobacteriales bacterium]|nr:MAG: hypothetical protein EOP53_08800 [Sphingobacteriales bacterium]